MADSSIKGVLDRGEQGQIGAALGKLKFGTRLQAFVTVVASIGTVASKIYGWAADLWDGLGKVHTDLGTINTNLNANLNTVRTDLSTIQTTINSDVGVLKTAIDGLVARVNSLMRPVVVGELVVTEHTITMDGPGIVLGVYATEGGNFEPKIVTPGDVSPGRVSVVYDGNGVPALQFDPDDHINGCTVLWIPTDTYASVDALSAVDDLTDLLPVDEIQAITDPEIEELKELDTDAATELIAELNKDFIE